MSNPRMTQNMARKEAAVAQLLAATEQDAAEKERRYGTDRGGDELPQELRRREGRVVRIRALRAKLLAAAQQQAQARQEAVPKTARAEAGSEGNEQATRRSADPGARSSASPSRMPPIAITDPSPSRSRMPPITIADSTSSCSAELVATTAFACDPATFLFFGLH